MALGGFPWLDDIACGPGTVSDRDLVDQGALERAILSAARSEPELVIVDAQVLRILMGDLARLLILDTFEGACKKIGLTDGALLEGEPPYVWDSDPLCGE